MFKRLFTVLLAVYFFFLCGCGVKKSVTPVFDGISFLAEIDYGDNEFSCDTSICDDVLNLTVTEPQELKGLTLNITKSKLKYEFNGLSYDCEIQSLPNSAVIQVLYAVLNDIGDNKTVDYSQENCEIKSQTNGYDYIFEFSPSGLPISLEIDNMDFKIEFKNVTVKR